MLAPLRAGQFDHPHGKIPPKIKWSAQKLWQSPGCQ